MNKNSAASTKTFFLTIIDGLYISNDGRSYRFNRNFLTMVFFFSQYQASKSGSVLTNANDHVCVCVTSLAEKIP